MSVFQSLSDEHRLIWGLIGRLEACLQEPDGRVARRDARAVLLVLLRALQGHGELENMIFERAEGAASSEAARALAEVERQHEALEALRLEAVDLLEKAADLDLARLRPLARRLAGALRAHFSDEERELWPLWKNVESRSMRRGLDRRAAERVKDLKAEVRGWWTAVDEYLPGR
ncbi:MAG: hemerythrin domain-containing protein [Elusimicrobia bacterium]|nr:hemerythrin domain-containing protein [Elusimicrobiota bacterium]